MKNFLKSVLFKSIYDQIVKLKWSEKILNLDNENIKDIKELGITKLNQNYSDFADYLKTNYIKNIISENNLNCPYKIFDNSSNKEFNLVNHYLSIEDPTIKNFILNKNLIFILNSIFNKKVYLRNDPLLQMIKTKDYSFPTNGQFHTDRFMQFSLMLLIDDLDEDSTHMEYMEASHKRDLFDLIIHKNFDQCDKFIKKNKFLIKKLIGKKGDAFLFDTTGIHRAKYMPNTMRSVFHLNFTNGHNLYPFKINNQNINEEIFLRSNSNLKFTNSGWKFF